MFFWGKYSAPWQVARTVLVASALAVTGPVVDSAAHADTGSGTVSADIGAGTIATYLPAIRVNSANLISPTTAWGYYSPKTTVTAMEQQPRIVELARALNYDPEAIYFYVKNNIRFEGRFGLQKGALGLSGDSI